jgi:hypothetical protein
MGYPRWVVEPIQRYWNLTDEEALQHVEAYMMTEQGRQEIRGILIKSGVDPKQIRKLKL